MTIKINGTNTTAQPSITGPDTDTGLVYGTNEVSIVTGGTEKVKVNSSGRVGIGTTSPGTQLHLNEPSTNTSTLRISNSDGFHDLKVNNGNLTISDATSDRLRIDSSGRLLVGTSSAQGVSIIQAVGSSSATTEPGDIRVIRGLNVSSIGSNVGAELGVIKFGALENSVCAQISAVCDANWSAGDYPGRLVFSTTADGASSPTERMRIDSAGSMVLASDTAFVAPYVYNQTTGLATNVNVDASGFLRRSTSSIKYKTNVETIQDQYADAILGCRPIWYQSTCEADKPEWGHWGFIAEEVAAIDPRLCFFKEEEDGTLEPEGVQYDRFVPHLLNLIKRQQQAIETLETQNASLEARLTALEGGAS